MIYRHAVCTLLVFMLGGFHLPAWAIDHAAQIVSLKGKGEAKGFSEKDWKSAAVEQKLGPGSFVRTGDMSNMALLFRDQTQVRLSQNSQLQIKTAAESGDSDTQTAMKLNAGRAWAQTKNVTGKLSMQTPTATMSIRGTDWDVEVAEDGKSTLTVLSGSVEFFNDFGAVTVNRGEQAVAEQGRAPVKLLISNPKERVQWVTSFEVDPLRHIRLSQLQGNTALEKSLSLELSDSERGSALYDLRRWPEAKQAFEQALAGESNNATAITGLILLALHEKDLPGAERWLSRLNSGELAALARCAYLTRSGELAQAKILIQELVATGQQAQPAARLILSDFLVAQGLMNEAINTDKATLAAFANSPIVSAHLARLYILADNRQAAQDASSAAIGATGDFVEPYLAQGEFARWDGDASTAQMSFSKAIELNQKDDRGWFGLGSVLNDKEDASRGREKLAHATELNPDGSGYEGELGLLETFADRYNAAQEHFNRALERNPDDYLALTGHGVMLLKRGQTEEALQEFLRAGVMEPRYARAHLYTGVAYYQLGRTVRALEEIDRARELDPHDPMPAMIASMIHTDQFDPARAIEASREANRLMPYLKSMNQLANNQKGVANVGNALSFWGMRDWAMHYAQDSWYPYWGGSHLFLSDLYSGSFARTSELFQGFLADPTVFGASNRNQTLVHRPGNYQSLSLTTARDHSVYEIIPKVTFNGYDNSLIPVAYFLDIENNFGQSRSQADFDYNDNTRSYTAAAGIKPTHELSLFAYLNRDYAQSNYRNKKITDLDFDLRTGDLSLGASYLFNPTSMLRAKYGENQIHGSQEHFDTIPATNELFDKELSHDYQISWQGRVMDSLELYVGAERATSPESSAFTMTTTGTGALLYDDRARVGEETNLAYLSGKVTLNPRTHVQLDAFYTDYEKTVTGGFINNFNATSASVDQRFTQHRLSPRIGLVWDTGGGHTFRFAWQDWVKPSSAGTLGPVATAGIALDETLTRFGGRERRGVLKLESEWSPTLYTEIALDHRQAENLGTFDLSLSESFSNLTRVRQRSLLDVVNAQAGVSNQEYDNLRFNDNADLDQIRLAANSILSARLSASVSYLHTNSDIELGGAHFYLPRHQLLLGTSWISTQRLRLGAELNWRSEAHTFQDMAHHFNPYASLNLSAYWETQNKHVGIAGFVRDALSPHDSTFYGVAATLRY